MFKFLPVSLYNVPAVETWLSDQARRGWHAAGFTSDNLIRGGLLWRPLMRFKRGRPEERRFRLEPCVRRGAAPDREALDLYAAAGWEYVAPSTQGQFYLWRSTRPDAGEIHTDPETEALAYGWLARAQRDAIRLVCGFLFLWVALVLFTMLTSQALLLPLIKPGLEGMHTLLIAILWLLGLALLDCKAIRTLRKRLADGNAAHAPAPYRLRHIARRAALVVILMLMVAVRSQNSEIFLREWEDFPVPSAAELGVEVEMDGPRGTLERSFIVERELSAAQDSRDAFGKEIASWQGNIYCLRLPSLAGQVLRDLAYSRVTCELDEAPAPLENTPFDEARYLRAPDGDQYLIARLGGRVLYYKANVPEDLRNHLEKFAAALSAA